MSLNSSPEEFTLLTHPKVLFSLSPSPPLSVHLKLSCISFPIEDSFNALPPPPTEVTSNNAVPALPPRPAAPPAKDVILLLRLGKALETPLFAGQRVTYDRERRTFGFHDADDVFEITFPFLDPPNVDKKESKSIASLIAGEEPEETDYESGADTFEVLLRDYGLHVAAISTPAPHLERMDDMLDEPPPVYTLPEDPRGHLLLVDNTTGQVLGSLGSPLDLDITESEAMQNAPSSSAVVVTLPSTSGQRSSSTPSTTETTVRPASKSEEEEGHPDLVPGTELLAHILKRGTSLLAWSFSSASHYYIAHIPPADSGPMHLSQQTQITIRRVNEFSNTAVRISAKTTNIIHGFLERSIAKVGEAASSLRPPAEGFGEPKPATPVQQAASQAGRILGRVINSADRLLTAVGSSTTEIIEAGTEEVSRALEHRYGPELGGASRLIGKSVRNVGVVYVDAQGIGRRALLKRAGLATIGAAVQGRRSVDQTRPQVIETKNGALLVSEEASTSAAVLTLGMHIAEGQVPGCVTGLEKLKLKEEVERPSDEDLINLG